MKKLFDALCPYLITACAVIAGANFFLQVRNAEAIADARGRCDLGLQIIEKLEGHGHD